MDANEPGAVVAFGLYFLRSNSHAAAMCCAQPDTAVLLGTHRPDVLMLHVISRALILWDAMNPTFLWVEAQLPTGLVRDLQQLRSLDNVQMHKCAMKLANADKETVQHVHANVIAGACFSLGLRYAGTSCRTALTSVQHYLAHFAILCVTGTNASRRGSTDLRSTQLTTRNGKVSPKSRQTHHIGEKQMARAAFIASAATECTRRLDQVVHDESHYHRQVCSAAIPTNESIATILCPDWPVLESCISATVIGLAMVMAGTGDLDSLLLLLDLRQMNTCATYGFHMAINMSIGLLFLGGGRASLSRNHQSTAALIAAFFPKFPAHAEDNHYHLQPLRHLWSLAVAWRGLEVIDADSGDFLSLPVKISLHDTIDWMLDFPPTLTLTAPCLLPPLEDLLVIEVVSSRYVGSVRNATLLMYEQTG